ncbi:MAG: PAS domain S-box protein [Spirulinaceae cyanobacterium RM2_2_10]|nr:PAS domain S-box protein [Spirulinaceae cyanobacterium RM2_2_10]
MHSLHGLTPGQFGGQPRHFVRLVEPSDRFWLRQTIRYKLFQREKPIFEFLYHIRKSSGRRCAIHARGRIYRDADGQPLAATGVCWDVTAQRSAEAVVRESEARLRDLFNFAPIGMAEVSLAGDFLDVNPALCDFLGYSTEQLLGLSLLAITYPGDRQSFETVFGALISGECDRYRGELRYSHNQGYGIHTILSCYVRCDRRSRPLSVIVQILDITERKRAEAALREQQQYLRLIIDNIPQQVFWKDTNLVFLGCNRHWAQAAGLPAPETVVGKTDYDLLDDPEAAEQYRERDRRIIATNRAELHIGRSPSSVQMPAVSRSGWRSAASRFTIWTVTPSVSSGFWTTSQPASWPKKRSVRAKPCSARHSIKPESGSLRPTVLGATCGSMSAFAA